MKMSVGLFWGIVLILVGLSLIVKIVFNIDFSIMRILFAFLFIYLGIRIFIGKDFRLFHDNKDGNSIIFSERTIKGVDDGKEYNVIFAGGKFDLSEMAIPDSQVVHIKLNTIFGGSLVIVNPDIPIQIDSNTAFGGTKMPNGNTSAFGSLNYENDSAKVSKPRLIIETNTVFGGLQVKNAHSPKY
jgi:predicted membrane protein